MRVQKELNIACENGQIDIVKKLVFEDNADIYLIQFFICFL